MRPLDWIFLIIMVVICAVGYYAFSQHQEVHAEIDTWATAVDAWSEAVQEWEAGQFDMICNGLREAVRNGLPAQQPHLQGRAFCGPTDPTDPPEKECDFGQCEN